MKIRLLTLGKIRRPELRAVFEDYVKRISHSCPVEVNEVRDAEAAIKRLDADRAATALLLDASGKQHDPDSLRERVPQKMSLSSMTYSHELARVMLVEQLYRAFAILSGSPYPK